MYDLGRIETEGISDVHIAVLMVNRMILSDHTVIALWKMS